MFNMIVATDKNGVIGKNNSIPWGIIAEDMRRFRKLTVGNTVIMGRKTYESIEHALPRRENVVLSRNPSFHAPNCRVESSVLNLVNNNYYNSRESFIIGGQEIYKLFLPYTSKIYMTIINDEYEGDTFFPINDLKNWRELRRADNEKMSFLTLIR